MIPVILTLILSMTFVLGSAPSLAHAASIVTWEAADPANQPIPHVTPAIAAATYSVSSGTSGRLTNPFPSPYGLSTAAVQSLSPINFDITIGQIVPFILLVTPDIDVTSATYVADFHTHAEAGQIFGYDYDQMSG